MCLRIVDNASRGVLKGDYLVIKVFTLKSTLEVLFQIIFLIILK